MRLEWDQQGEKTYETGVDHGVLYPNIVTTANSRYYADQGAAWNGLTAVNESPSGAEAEKIYADNIVYLTLTSAEEYSATIEAYTYPDEFADCNGETQAFTGVTFGQQNRKTFGFAFRTIKGNDTDGDTYGTELHLLYGLKASPSSKDHSTVNDSPEAVQMSWEVNSTPVAFKTAALKPVSTIVIDSTKFKSNPEKFAQFEDIIWGCDATSESYVQTTDATPVSTKTYYILVGSAYQAVDPTPEEWTEGQTYYEKIPAKSERSAQLPTPQSVYDFFNGTWDGSDS